MQQVALVSGSAMSSAYANELHISEPSTEFLELSGLVWCAMGFHCIVHSCPESTGKPQPCLAAGTTKWGCSVPAKPWQGTSLPSGERHLQFRTCSLKALALGQHPHRLQSLGIWALHNLPPASVWTNSFCLWNPFSVELDYKWIYQSFLLFFFFFSGEKGTRTKTSYTCKVVLCSFGTLFKIMVVQKLCWRRNLRKKNLRKQNSCNLMDAQ